VAERITRLVEPTRYDVTGAAGTWKEFALPALDGGQSAEFVTYFALIHAMSSTTNVQLELRLDCSPDGGTAKPHTTQVIAGATIPSRPLLRWGDGDHSKLLGEFLHPVIRVQTVDGAAQFVVVELWELRHGFPRQQGLARHRRVASGVRLKSGAVGAAGFALPGCDRGHEVRTVVYSVVLLEASGTGAKLGCDIQTSPNGEYWATQRSNAPVADGALSGVAATFVSDTAKGIGQHFRPVFTTQSTAGDELFFDVWETCKPV
jgi:hypothetical protein